MDTKLFLKHLAKQQKLIVESDVDEGSKTLFDFGNSVDCVVIGAGDDFRDFTTKRVMSGLKKGAKFKASTTADVLKTLKCEQHMIQPDQLQKIKSGKAKMLYVFVDPFHAQEHGERIVQIFADKSKADEWYKESFEYGSAPVSGPDYIPR